MTLLKPSVTMSLQLLRSRERDICTPGAIGLYMKIVPVMAHSLSLVILFRMFQVVLMLLKLIPEIRLKIRRLMFVLIIHHVMTFQRFSLNPLLLCNLFIK